MADGTYKKVKDIRKGDSVMTATGKSSKIVCVVNTNCSSEKSIEVVQIGNLIITPYHPILHP